LSGPAPSRRPLLAGNWKMNPTRAEEADDLARGVVEGARTATAPIDVVVLPPFPWLRTVAAIVKGSGVGLGAQDCFWEPSGAYTGEVSAAMLSGWCDWVLVGHSERRHKFGETDEWVSRKARAALSEALKVMVCVGELDEQFEAGQTDSVVSGQLRAAIDYLPQGDSGRLAVAYEPVWAIGTGKNADPEHAQRTMSLIRTVLGESFGAEAAERVRVLYGGSVNAANVGSYVELPVCDGCLVGGASLKASEFTRMIETVSEAHGGAPGGAGTIS
jgi:triosephosphate isomerase (TIM)